MNEIWKERLRIDKERREEQSRRMEEYDRDVYHPARKELRERCAAEAGGHNWQYSHNGPLGDPWFVCKKCGASECRRDDDAT